MSKWIIDNRAKGMKSDINFLLRLKRTHNDKMDKGSHYQNYFIDCKNSCHNIRRRSIGDEGLLFHPLKAFNKVFNSGDLSVKVILWCQIRQPRIFAGTRSVLKGLANSFVHELLVSLMKWDVKKDWNENEYFKLHESKFTKVLLFLTKISNLKKTITKSSLSDCQIIAQLSVLLLFFIDWR